MNKPLRKRSLKTLLELKPVLDEITGLVESSGYIHQDPVQFMHAFESKRDREIAGFLAALMAWGRRDIVIHKTEELLERMDYSPYSYVSNYAPSHASDFRGFRHRTFNSVDLHGLISALQIIYSSYDDFEAFWSDCRLESRNRDRNLLSIFRERFLAASDELKSRTYRHISCPEKNSTCKRLTMYLRWATRKNSPVDAGIWDFMPASELLVPLDVHVARQARRLGLLTRRSSDWKAVEEVTDTFRLMDPEDPSRYDFALFGIGALGHVVPQKFLLNPLS